MRNDRGVALVEVIIASAILLTVAMGFSILTDSMQKETRKLSQKLEILNLNNGLLSALSRANICACNFDPAKNTLNEYPLTFSQGDLANAKIQIKTLYQSCDSGGRPIDPIATSGSVLPGNLSTVGVSQIEINRIVATGGAGDFRAKLEVKWDTRLELGRKPVELDISFRGDVTNPGAVKITSCAAGPSGGGAPLSLGRCQGIQNRATACTVSPPSRPSVSPNYTYDCSCPVGTYVTTCLGAWSASSGGGEAGIETTSGMEVGQILSDSTCRFLMPGNMTALYQFCCQ